jgi:hypothetical protein
MAAEEISSDYKTFYKLGENESMSPRWAKQIVFTMVLVMPILILSLAPSYHWPIAFFAYLNCVLYGMFVIYFLKRRILNALIPAIAPIRLVLGSCVGIIYFAMFYPDGYYATMTGPVSYFAGGVRYQAAIFLFLLIYFTLMAWFLRKEPTASQNQMMCSKNIAYLCSLIIVPIIGFNAFSRIVSLPSFLDAWASRLHVYYHSLLFVVGALITRVSKNFQLWLAVFLAGMVFFYTLGNARGRAMAPIMAMICGMFLFSALKSRTKIIIICIIAFLLPWYMLIGNTTRALSRTSGGAFEDLGYRLSLLKQWKTVVKEQSVGLSFFGRLFYTGGNVIVAQLPSQYPYRSFSLPGYAKEALIFILPGPIIQKMQSAAFGSKVSKIVSANYTGNWMANDYGLNVSETTAVTTSLIGNLWMFGGFTMIFFGAFLLAMLHKFSAWILRRAWDYRPEKGIFYFAIVFQNIYSTFDHDLISQWRGTIWLFIFAFSMYKLVVEPLLRIFPPSLPQEENLPQLMEYAE